jgi:hypothetical protein
MFSALTVLGTAFKGVLKSKKFWAGVALLVAAFGAAGLVPVVDAVSTIACTLLGGCS